MDAISDHLPYPHPRRRPTQAERARSGKEIRRIEGEISNLTDKVGKLQDQIDEWQRIKANHLSFIASFRCLPEELLTEILRLSLDSDVSHGTLSSICGTIRGIVIGTSTFWNRIRIHNRRPGLLPSAISSGIPCHKREHLDFILTCASATPLDLWVDSDAPEHRIDLLELVVSHGCEISSLTLDSLEDELVLDPTLKILNLRALNVLSMNNLSREAIEKVMDLALQSDQGEMRIVMSPKPEASIDSLLLHPLLRRPGHLELCLAHDFSTSHISAKISLPQLKILRIPDKSLLDMFDLNHVENLDIWGIAPYMPRFTSGLPIQLTTLSIRSLNLTSRYASEYGCHSLPSLTTLHLISIKMNEPLQTFFDVPRLKHIVLNTVNFTRTFRWVNKDANGEGGAGGEFFPSSLLFLQTVTFINVSVGRTDFFPGLPSYPNLWSITIRGGGIITFALALFDHLDPSTGFFLALRRIEIKNSWPGGFGVSREELAHRCNTRRPPIALYG